MRQSFGDLAVTVIKQARLWARRIKVDVVALYIAGQDRRTPWHAKVVALVTAAYALSPIDLIPDFIPLLGYLDDLVIVPLGIMLAVRLIPAALMVEFRAEAMARGSVPINRFAAAIIICIWLMGLAIVARWLARYLWPQ
jgi:uncharacterized membrane protein YkvA (DUF1232 family)